MTNPLLKTRVWCGFPGVGKSSLVNQEFHHLDIEYYDSDSSRFSKEPDWPLNYTRHIQGILDSNPKAVILVSTHQAVVTALALAGMDFGIVIPSIRIKDEYLARYQQRGNDVNFIGLIDQNWKAWLLSLFDNPNARNVVVMGSGQYLSDVLGVE